MLYEFWGVSFWAQGPTALAAQGVALAVPVDPLRKVGPIDPLRKVGPSLWGKRDEYLEDVRLPQLERGVAHEPWSEAWGDVAVANSGEGF